MSRSSKRRVLVALLLLLALGLGSAPLNAAREQRTASVASLQSVPPTTTHAATPPPAALADTSTPAHTRSATRTATTAPSPTPSRTPTPTATDTPTPLPTLALRVTLAPFGHEWQTWNSWGPAVLVIGRSYFGVERTRSDMATVLRSEAADKNVYLDELLAYAAGTGEFSRKRVNRTVYLLRKLNSAGIPVLTEGWLRVGEHIGHYGIVRGYDLETGRIRTQHSFHGPNLWLDTEDFEAMWEPFFFAYAPLYRAGDEPLVAALPGPERDDQGMLARALEDAQAAVTAGPEDPASWYDLGDAHFLRGPHRGCARHLRTWRGDRPALALLPT